MTYQTEKNVQKNNNSALAVGLALVAFAGLLLAFFADTDSTVYLRAIGIGVAAVFAIAATITFQKNKK